MGQRRWGFPGGPVVMNLPANAGDTGSTLVWELRSYMLQGNEAHVPHLLKPAQNLRAATKTQHSQKLCN